MAEDKPAKKATGKAPSFETDPKTISAMNLWQKLAAITGEVGLIAKDGKNAEQKYSFIEYAAVAGALRTLFAKYNVMVIPHMKDRQVTEITSSYGKSGKYVVINFEFHFTNADKPTEKEIIEWVGEAADYGDKATNKAATGALKYCLMRTFNVSEKGDEDPDAHTPDVAAAAKAPAPKPKVTIQDIMARISATLIRKGFADSAERKTLILNIAGLDDPKKLRTTHLAHVTDIVENTPIRDLQGYLDTEISEEVATAPADADWLHQDIVDLADKAAKGTTKKLEVPTYPAPTSSKLIHPKMLKDMRELIQKLALGDAEVATLVQGTISKDQPSNYADGLAVVTALVEEVNARNEIAKEDAA